MGRFHFYYFIFGLLLAIRLTAQTNTSEDYNPVTPLEDPSPIQNILDELAAEPDQTTREFILHPPNTSSPRDTMISFMKITQRFYDLISDDDYSQQDRIEVFYLFEQVEDFFDLRQIAPSLRADYATASAIYLRETIDRIGLPPVEEIPDEETMYMAIDKGFPARWQVPETPFEIIRVDEGENAGHYVFSDETLREVRPLFKEVRNLPYKSRAAEDFYYYFFLTPNPIIPKEWINSLPDWALEDFAEQTVWQWACMIIVMLIALIGVIAIYIVVRRVGKKLKDKTRHALSLTTPIGAIIAAYITYDIIDDKIFITGEVFQMTVYVIYSIILAASITMTFMLGTLLADIVGGSERLENRSFDAQLTRIGVRILSIIVCLAILIRGLQEIGFSLATVVAGAGVTGLAVALAAQSTLRNIFGSLMLLLDKPFRVGDRVKIGAVDGAVEEIGLRSTKVRLLTGHVTSIPNDRLADVEIENVARRPYIRRVSNITITYDTPQEKIPLAVEIIREALSVPEDYLPTDGNTHPNDPINRPMFPPRVFFNEFNPASLNILMIYWYHPPAYWDFLEFSQKVNEEIIRRFSEAGIEFAFPTQTIHLAGEKVTPFPQIEADTTEKNPTSDNSPT
ncbi:mechanosensitive ion channel family protein [Cerasicoccus maritimus]|uniref:mechanosensitive ion channel family protein n=1 Tax=Cerasicoccus maritimus TaxID=490089 RepID=UPI002852C236|nr:mechanosensitive ion channel domain-containing protein [Cerasicoccus maritimus]